MGQNSAFLRGAPSVKRSRQRTRSSRACRLVPCIRLSGGEIAHLLRHGGPNAASVVAYLHSFRLSELGIISRFATSSFGLFLIGWLLLSLAVASFSSLYPVLMAKSFAIDVAHSSLLMSLATAASIPVYNVAGRWASRFGAIAARFAGVAGRMLAVAGLAIVAYLHGPMAILPVIVLFGLYQGIWPLLSVASNDLAALAPFGKRLLDVAPFSSERSMDAARAKPLLVIALAFAVVAFFGDRAAAQAETPQTLCRSVVTDDALRPLPLSLVRAAQRLFHLDAMPAAQIRRSTYFRCFEREVLLCTGGANIPCGKANTRKDLPGAVAWCRDHPDDDVIPFYATGHDTIYRWRCTGAQPTAEGPAETVDARGFIARYWKPLDPRP